MQKLVVFAVGCAAVLNTKLSGIPMVSLERVTVAGFFIVSALGVRQSLWIRKSFQFLLSSKQKLANEYVSVVSVGRDYFFVPPCFGRVAQVVRARH